MERSGRLGREGAAICEGVALVGSFPYYLVRKRPNGSNRSFICGVVGSASPARKRGRRGGCFEKKKKTCTRLAEPSRGRDGDLEGRSS